MKTIGRSLVALCIVLCSLSTLVAQDSKSDSPPISTTTTTLTITVAATAERVRFTAPSTVVRMHIEIYSEAGETLFDGSSKGNVFDWTLADSSGQHVADGSYLSVVTAKTLGGKISQRMGQVTVQDKQVSVRGAQSAQLSPAQQQAVGPVEENAALTVLAEGDTPSATVIAHDGRNGQVTSTQGALTFRTGDVFVGKETERMRITEDGRVGIGTDNPETMFDVAGAIRARGGIVFNDGTALTSTGRAGRVNKSGEVMPNASGTGTQNFIAKWQETGGAGTLGDSGIFEAPNGFIGIGTTTPPHPFSVRRNGGTIGVHSVGELFVDRDDRTRSASLTVGTGGTLKWIFGMPSGTDGFQVYDLTNNVSRLFVDPTSGNFGIGTTTPAHRLDVAGAINATTEYRIGGQPVLSVPGVTNTFAGIDAGLANTTGIINSFFGRSAGASNTEGDHNSFFGAFVGVSNTTGDFNSFFGVNAGSSNTTGNLNSIFGQDAGWVNTTGFNNSFFGGDAGFSNRTGFDNSFFGQGAGGSNTTGTNNTIIGENADVGSGTLTFATAIGSRAIVSNSNSVVLGRINDTVRIPGNLIVSGTVSKGGGSFKIDHPLDPANKTLSHSFVESPDMMNVYNGNVTTDRRGLAVVTLPAYFEALNRDFRYQLTALGQFAQAIVWRKIEGNRFVIKTSKPSIEVSWQVTGIRKDAFANTNRIPVEEEKPERERGTYLHPGVFNQPAEQSGVRAASPPVSPQQTKAVNRRRPAASSR